ncbi:MULTISPECIES: universal stress protein [Aliivibrio]|jgi:RimJ/RimL family protein N-acetyltransferase|uniref:Universal stress protein n=3 Tax=Aliivibrio TaxID=511678 RepID=A0A1B9NVT7_ALILO|nr:MULTISPECIES: universal stress protein [Aliivibrio]AZL86045.1 universal stress protein [Aliivibrio salmonicida]AZL86108.1 universal stress protein [Aliivibrio salmonicida]MBB1313267.1 universal stress protein [Aliivibrio sp. SR45-2]OCH18699.1 universal stress protein [Aliivibrio logei]OEF11217.1 universal stress protein [Aliivibrio logei 5S-186]
MKLYQTILLALNPDDSKAHKLMVKAGVLAKQNDAELHVIFVEVGIGDVNYMDVELELESSHNALEFKRIEQLSILSKESPYPVRAVHIADGNIVKHISEIGDKINTDLVIIGYHKSKIHWGRTLGDEVSDKLKCDVMIAQ